MESKLHRGLMFFPNLVFEILELIALWRCPSSPVRLTSLDESLHFGMTEAAMNPVVVLVWHSSVVAAVWHRGQRRCLGGDVTWVLACVGFLNLIETAGLDLKKIKLFVKKKEKKSFYCFPRIFRASLLAKVCKDFEDSTELSGWAHVMAPCWVWKWRVMPGWHQTQTGKLSPISCWACWGLCALHFRPLPEKNFQCVTFGCLQNSSMPSTGGMLRGAKQRGGAEGEKQEGSLLYWGAARK